MTKKQFFEYLEKVRFIENAKKYVEDLLCKLNLEPTLTMFPDFGERELIYCMMYDSIVQSHGIDSADLFQEVWYESELIYEEPSYETDCYSIKSTDDLWNAIEAEKVEIN